MALSLEPLHEDCTAPCWCRSYEGRRLFGQIVTEVNDYMPRQRRPLFAEPQDVLADRILAVVYAHFCRA